MDKQSVLCKTRTSVFNNLLGFGQEGLEKKGV